MRPGIDELRRLHDLNPAHDPKPADEVEALRAAELELIRAEKMLCEPLCAQCLRRISICECEHGRP